MKKILSLFVTILFIIIGLLICVGTTYDLYNKHFQQEKYFLKISGEYDTSTFEDISNRGRSPYYQRFNLYIHLKNNRDIYTYLVRGNKQDLDNLILNLEYSKMVEIVYHKNFIDGNSIVAIDVDGKQLLDMTDEEKYYSSGLGYLFFFSVFLLIIGIFCTYKLLVQ